MARKYRKVNVGGTFDLLHKGHVCLIKKTLEIGDYVTIDLTADEFLKDSFKSHFVANFDERREGILRFLESLGEVNRVQIVPLNDLYGTAILEKELDAVVVSYETWIRFVEINEIRFKKGLKPLEVVVLEAVLAEDGFPISSTRIRRGEIDRDGHLLS